MRFTNSKLLSEFNKKKLKEFEKDIINNNNSIKDNCKPNSELTFVYKVNLNPFINNNDVNKLLIKQQNRDLLSDTKKKSLNISSLNKNEFDLDQKNCIKNKKANTKFDNIDVKFNNLKNKDKSFVTNLDLVGKLVFKYDLKITDANISFNKKNLIINREEFFNKDFKIKATTQSTSYIS